MVVSKETTPAAYLASLPAERRKVVAKVRSVVKKHLPKGYVETMNWGMISYEVPLSRYPDTYNKQPLMYMGLAAQKNNYVLHMVNVYADPALRGKLEAGYKAAGKKLDMGKGCLRFKSLEDIPLDVIAEIVAATPVVKRIATEQARSAAGLRRLRRPGDEGLERPRTRRGRRLQGQAGVGKGLWLSRLWEEAAVHAEHHAADRVEHQALHGDCRGHGGRRGEGGPRQADQAVRARHPVLQR